MLLAVRHAAEATVPYHLTVNIGADEPIAIVRLARCMVSIAVDMGIIDGRCRS